MPTCKKCCVDFPNHIVLDDKARNIQNRKYCLVCSPFGLHNTKQIHIDSEPKNCQYCKREYFFKIGTGHKTGHKLTSCNSCNTSRRRIMLKHKAIKYLGGKCQICNYDRCIEALDFHHSDPTNKSFQISGNYNKAWEKLQSELDKCILLCANCHREQHYLKIAEPQ